MGCNHVKSSSTVASVDKVGPTHAKGLTSLVGLNASVRQGSLLAEMPLDVEVSCGIAPIRISGQDFQLALRTCFVALARNNCEVGVGTTYEYWLSDGAFEATSEEQHTTERGQSAGINAGAEADTSKATGGLIAKLNLAWSRQKGTKIDAKSKRSSRTELIVTSGQDRWRIGDFRKGDARREDGLLNGSYFNETQAAEFHAPLCTLSCNDPTQLVEISVSVCVAYGSLLVLRGEGSPTTIDKTTGQTLLRRRGAAAAQEHNAAEIELRAKVAGLVLTKAMRRAQAKAGLPVPDNEILIARQTLIVQPKLDKPDAD
jgi:hypothetical protein